MQIIQKLITNKKFIKLSLDRANLSNLIPECLMIEHSKPPKQPHMSLIRFEFFFIIPAKSIFSHMERYLEILWFILHLLKVLRHILE